jgi:hypothetical protein
VSSLRQEINRLAVAALQDEQAFEGFLALTFPKIKNQLWNLWTYPPPGYSREDFDQIARIEIFESISKWDASKSDALHFAYMSVHGKIATLFQRSNSLRLKGDWNTINISALADEDWDRADPTDSYADVDEKQSASCWDQFFENAEFTPHEKGIITKSKQTSREKL